MLVCRSPFVMGWDLVVIRWFCELCCGVVVSEGDSNISVFKDLKAILTLVCLNRLVILHMCGEVKVKVAHCGLFSVLVGVWRTLFCVVFGVLICEGGLLGICCFFAMWRMVCHSLCCWSSFRGMLNILSI